MTDFIENLFKTKEGSAIYKASLRAIRDFSMDALMRDGVVVGLSGGADSVILLCVLLKYKIDFLDFPIVAVHVNHMIRGYEADRDCKFSELLCQKLNVEFLKFEIDVPAAAREKKRGIEETARACRYEVFDQVLIEKKFSAIAVAHNSTDNLETAIFNMMRGAGSAGLAGISPVREALVRPLIYCSKNEIRSALDSCGVDYVVDSTNLSVEYTRNYIRQEIIPRLERINEKPEVMATRLSRNLREDNEFIESAADAFFMENCTDGTIPLEKLLHVHKALFYRVLLRLVCSFFGKKNPTPERTHVDVIFSKLKDGDFCYSLPGNVFFVSKQGRCYIASSDNAFKEGASISTLRLNKGINHIDGISTVVLLCDDEEIYNYSNIYKIAIKTQLQFAIIEGELLMRSKREGDAYAYGGCTHKLKKLFNDKKIPPEYRGLIPVFCDDVGIVWVPGFGKRENKSSLPSVNGDNLYIALAEPLEGSSLPKLYYNVK